VIAPMDYSENKPVLIDELAQKLTEFRQMASTRSTGEQ
jgi:hypothetical protein